MPTHLVGRIDLFTSQWIEHVLNSSLPIHAFCLRQSKSELLKLITEEIDLNRSYCEPTKTNRIVANKQRRNRQVGCEDEEGRWKLAANRQQYAENKFRFINLNVPKINWKFCFFFSFLVNVSPMIANIKHLIADGVKKSVEFICVHITDVAACIPARRRWRHENQLNNKSFSLVRDRITRRQQIKWQRYIYGDNETHHRALASAIVLACCHSIWNNFLGFFRISWTSSSTLSPHCHSMDGNGSNISNPNANKSIPTEANGKQHRNRIGESLYIYLLLSHSIHTLIARLR